ncbi:MAG: LamG-like jellyroll fold domain-containing protein, partial [Bacteroidota bacterium]
MSKSIFTIQHFYTKFLGILTLILCLSFCVSAQNIGHEQREAEYQPYAPALAKHYHNLTFADITGRASGTSTQIDHEWEYLSSSDPCAEIDNIVLDFDGTDDRVELGNFSFYQDNFTIEGWINSSQTNDATLFHVYDGLNSGIFIGRTGNSIRFIVRNPPNNSGGAFRIGTTNVFDGNWHHFAAVKGSDNRLYLYIDGVLEGSNSGTIGDFGSNVYDVVLGYNNPNSPRYYNGQMDEVRLWNIERTQTEIQNNKDMELTGSETGLVAYYDFNQGIPDANNTSETTLLDRTTNGNDGTLTNFSLTAGTVSNWTSPGPFTTGGALILSLTNDSPACAGDDITFVAMGNGANNYEFFLDADMDGEVDNGESLQNGASNTYVSSTLSDGDVISVLGSRTSGCTAVATSTVTVNASPTITSFNNDSPVCAGEAITFTANASEASNYEFFSDIDMDGEVDGGESLQTGASDTYTTSSLNDGDVISVLVTATSGCTAIATSTVTINTNPSLSLSNSGSACASDTITFTATGGLANYDFFLDENTNGALDAGELLQSSTSNILKINNLIDGDIIGVLASDVNTCTAIATSTASVDAFDLSGIDNALNLDGSDDYVDIPSATNMPQGNAPRTMEAWVKTTQTSIGNIISWGTRSTRQRNGLAVRDGKLAFIGQFHDFRGKITINDGEWHHLVITYDGTNWRLFVDGNEDEKVRQFGDPFNDELNTVGNNLRIGLISQPSVGEYYNGTVDEVRIWNYARSTAQILASKDVELTGNETGLLAYYKFNQGTADADNTGQTTLLDFTSNTSNGTLLNFTLNGSTSNWTSSRASLPINNVALSNSGPVCPGEDITFSATKGASNYEFFDDANQNGLIDVGESLQNGISRLYTTNTFTDGDTISVLATDPNGCTTVVTSIARTSDFALLSGGNALDFDGENDYVDAGNILTSSYTKEVWVNIDLSNGLANNLLSGSNTQAQHIFWTPAIYGYRVSAGHNGDWGAVRDAEPIPAGWQHYAVTYDAPTTSMKLYRNGNLVAENDNVPNYTGGNQVLIGAFENNNLFGGRLDEVRIWDYARTEAEIKTQREVALTGSETGLIAYYDFNQGIPNDNNTGQTTLLDRSTNSNNATLVNFSLGAGKNSNWTNSDAPIEVTDLQVVNNSPVCDGEAVSFTVSEGALNYEFFLDANTNGLVDNGESLQSGSGNTYVDSSLVSGDVISILLTDTKGCTTVITSTPTIQSCGSTGFIVTYRTTSPNELIRIPTISFVGFVYNYSVDWGDGTSDTGLTGDASHIYATPGLYTVSIEGEFPGIFFDDNSSSRRKI